MLKRTLLLSTLLLPSLAMAASENVGPSGMHAAGTELPAPPRHPLATLKAMFEQLGDTRALVQYSVTDEVSRQLDQLRAARSASVLRR